jgi:hypothetical protein
LPTRHEHRCCRVFDPFAVLTALHVGSRFQTILRERWKLRQLELDDR